MCPISAKYTATAVLLAPAPTTVISPLRSIYASL